MNSYLMGFPHLQRVMSEGSHYKEHAQKRRCGGHLHEVVDGRP